MNDPIIFKTSARQIVFFVILALIGGNLLAAVSVALARAIFELTDTAATVIGSIIALACLVISLTFLFSLRVNLFKNKIVKQSCFGKQEIPLSPETSVRYANVSTRRFPHFTDFRFFTETDYTFSRGGIKMDIILTHGTTRMKIGSLISSKGPLFTRLRALELEEILPKFVDRLGTGHELQLGPFTFGNGEVSLHGYKSVMPLSTLPKKRRGQTIFTLGEHEVSVTTDCIECPYTVASLIVGGAANSGSNASPPSMP